MAWPISFLFCVAALLLSWQPCDAATKLRGWPRRNSGFGGLSNGIKGKRRLNKNIQGKTATTTEAETLFFTDGGRKGIPENVGVGRVADHAEEEAMFFGTWKATEPKSSRNGEGDGTRASRSYDDYPYLQEQVQEEDDHESLLQEEQMQEQEEKKGKGEEATESGLGRMEGHPLMHHNSFDDEMSEESFDAQPAIIDRVKISDEGSEMEEEYEEGPPNPHDSLVEEPNEEQQNESYTLEEMAPPQDPEHIAPSEEQLSETFAVEQMAEGTSSLPSSENPTVHVPLTDETPPEELSIVEDTLSNEDSTEKSLPDTELVTFPTEADASTSPALSVFGGNLVEPVNTFSDHPKQNQHADTISSIAESPGPNDEIESEQLQGEHTDEKPHQSSNHRQQPTQDERAKRTAVIVVSGAGFCSLLLALTYLADHQKKRRRSPDTAQKLELDFGGSLYETDTDSSAPSGDAARGPYAMESILNDGVANDACDIIDPWSLEGSAQHIDFGNIDFPSHGGYETRGRKISTTIDVYRRRIANYVPRRTATIYEELDERSEASDPVFEDGNEQEYMRKYGKSDSIRNVKEQVSQVPEMEDAKLSKERKR